MKAIVGTAPNLPWWRLQNMTDEEIEKFNRKHLVEIEMAKAIIEYCPMCDSNYLSDLPHDCTMIIIKPIAQAMSDDASKDGWNTAIEAAAKICDKYDSYGAAYEIRKTLKK